MWRWRFAVGLAALALSACGRSSLDMGYVDAGGGPSTGGAGASGTTGTGARGSSGGSGAKASSGGTGGASGSDAGASGGDGGSAGSGSAGVPPLAESSCATGEDATRFAHGKTHYVDDTPGCEGLTPCYTTVAAAVANAAKGDTVLLLPGTHTGTEILVEDGGPVDLRVTSRDGPGVTFVERPCFHLVDWAEEPGEVWIDHLSFQNCGPHTSFIDDGWGVYVTGDPDVGFRLFDNVFVNAGASGGISVDSNLIDSAVHGVIARNWLLDHVEPESFPLAVSVADVEGSCVRIENNVIAGNLRGSSVGPRSEFVNNTLANNQTESLGAAIHAVSANNLFVNEPGGMWTPEWGFEYVHPQRGEFHHNLVWSGAFSGWNSNFSADPRFFDAAGRNFRPRTDSPAIGRGSHPEAPTKDMEGRPRPNPPTLGAFESDPFVDTRANAGCGDGIIEWGPLPTDAGTYTGFETCDPGQGSMDPSCDELCQLRAAVPHRLVSASSGGVCAIRINGELACWKQAAEHMPAGAFTQVIVGGNLACALGQDGSVTCWADYGPAFAPAAKFSEIARGMCALSADGVTCWDGSGITRTVPGAFVHVDDSCAITADGERTCWTHATNFPAGQFIQMVSWGLSVGCGFGRDGSLTCTDPSRGATTPQVLPAGFAQVDAVSDTLVGLRRDGRVVEWHPTYVAYVEPDRVFIDVTPGAGLTGGCALTPARQVRCWPHDPTLPEE